MTIIHDFSKRFCGSGKPEQGSVEETLKTNYETCWKLANHWATESISSRLGLQESLKAGEVAARLYSAGNRSYAFYQQVDKTAGDGKPTLEQCVGVVKKHYQSCQPGYWNKIQCIKDIRSLTGCGIKEAKYFAEAVVDNLNSGGYS